MKIVIETFQPDLVKQVVGNFNKRAFQVLCPDFKTFVREYVLVMLRRVGYKASARIENNEWIIRCQRKDGEFIVGDKVWFVERDTTIYGVITDIQSSHLSDTGTLCIIRTEGGAQVSLSPNCLNSHGKNKPSFKVEWEVKV